MGDEQNFSKRFELFLDPQLEVCVDVYFMCRMLARQSVKLKWVKGAIILILNENLIFIYLNGGF